MGQKDGGLLCPFLGSWDSVYYNVAWAEVYFRTKRRLHPSSHLATIDMGQKLGGGGCALFLGVAGSTSNTMSRRPRYSSVTSGILIHPTVWPQYTNVADRQTDRQGSGSIGRNDVRSRGKVLGAM